MTQRWQPKLTNGFQEARIDLRAAEYERTADPPITADIVFHAQQLAEKLLEASRNHCEMPPA